VPIPLGRAPRPRSAAKSQAVVLAVAALLCCGIAGADVELGVALANLKSTDFRLRTQAALALGASKDAKAVAPLCHTLSDENVSVRAAAAAALGRLTLGGEDCVEARLAQEPNDSVKSALQKALEALDGGEPKFTSETHYYLAFGKLTDKSGRAGNELERVVRKAVSGAAGGLPQLVLAPRHEAAPRAKERLAKRPSVKAFYLSPRVAPFEYKEGALTVRLEIAMFSYPERAMVGNFSVRLTQPDVPRPDPSSENELVAMAAERALEKFTKIAASL